MTKINEDSLVDIIFTLRWKSDVGHHTDCYQAKNVNIWRDYFPPGMLNNILGKETGERADMPLTGKDFVPEYDADKLLNVKRSQFQRGPEPQHLMQPMFGRFYPKGWLKNVSGIFTENIQPFRCVGVNNGNMAVDLNHPMAGKNLKLSCLIGRVEQKTVERGGTSIDWIETLTDGPGMQARWQSKATDYFTMDAFDRKDERPDDKFYEEPRFIQHIDDTAIEMVRNTYGRFLTSGMRVLDLMSSWQSHVPPNIQLERLDGLGLNSEELKRNRQLSKHVVQDLNRNKTLPYESNVFDVVLNTVSVEYLTDPIAIFREVARVLRPGGQFVVTFSNRWFPPKAIKVWEELHDFERMGLVSEYFMRSGGFTDMNTYSIRGLPRPHDDKYFPEFRYSDPIFAVWGQKG